MPTEASFPPHEKDAPQTNIYKLRLSNACVFLTLGKISGDKLHICVLNCELFFKGELVLRYKHCRKCVIAH